MIASDTEIVEGHWRRTRYLAPVVVFIALTFMLGWGLTHDPRQIPSTLIGKSVPRFSLPPVKGRLLGLSDADLKGEVSLVNVFASWCVTCREEHRLLLKMKADGVVPIHGLARTTMKRRQTDWRLR